LLAVDAQGAVLVEGAEAAPGWSSQPDEFGNEVGKNRFQ